MSPSFVNTNAHPVRVNDPLSTGADRLRRVIPGQVVEAEGAYADNLEATAGVEKASKADRERYERAQAGVSTDSEGSRIAAKDALNRRHIELRQATTAAPARRVVGDDLAPVGPPSGTVTTKAEAAEASPEAREAYAQHEALPGEHAEHGGLPQKGLPTGADVPSEAIHNAQVEAAEAAEAVAQEALSQGADPTSPAVEPTSSGESAEASADFNVSSAKKPELEAEAERRELKVQGTGADGAVTANDLRKALAADNRRQA